MAKKNEIAVRSGGLQVQDNRPTWLGDVNREAKGLEGLSKVVRPSTLKIVQKNSSDELTEKFSVGSMILLPEQLLLADKDSNIIIVPILYYREFIKWAPIALKNVEAAIQGRTFDENSEIGKKARNPALWSEKHPQHPDDKKYNYRYVEHLNFIVKTVSPELIDLDPFVVSFAKTNYVTGTRFAKLALSRKAPLFAGQYSLGTRVREGAENSWRINTIENHIEQPWLSDESLYNACAQLHDDFVALREKQALETQYDQEDVVDAEIVSAGDTGQY